jgi:hypothetical protein
MNDVTTAKESFDVHTEEREIIVELGVVSEDTHGHWTGRYLDGTFGYFL